MSSLHPNETLCSWFDPEKMPSFSPLARDLKTDVCVIGGGIAGLTTAYLLMKQGKKVALLEDFELASGQTGKTTAHFSNALDDRYFDIEKYHGLKGAQLAAESHTAAIAQVENIVRQENIDCDFEYLDGFLVRAHEEENDTILSREFHAATRAGLQVDFLDGCPIDSLNTCSCLRFPRQMQLHPIKYLQRLAEILAQNGVEIFTHTRAVHVEGGLPAAQVQTKNKFTVTCEAVVVATNSPFNDLFAIHTKQAPYRTYVIGVTVPQGSVPKGLYWDTLDPYHFVRLQKIPNVEGETKRDLLIVGGEDHKTGQDDDPKPRFDKLEEWTRKCFPMAQEVLYRWSGQVMEPVDGMAFLGRNPFDTNNVYVITGDSGNGMTHATIGAMLITDQIMGAPNEWAALYEPSRVSLRATSEFLKENANVAAQYGDWFAEKSDEDLMLLEAGEGKVIRDGLRMLAAYKNESGRIEYLSAACPHLAGVVHWNPVEKSWDCPCHGSRFDCNGRVIEGPAFKDLEKVQTEIALPEEVRVF